MAGRKRNTILVKHRKFADRLIEGMSGIEAYEAVYGTKGKSRNARYVQACVIQQRPEVDEYIKSKLDKLDREYAAKKHIQMMYWQRIRDGIEDIEIYDGKDRLSASEKLGRAMGMFVERTESTLKGQMEVVIRPPKGFEKC